MARRIQVHPAQPTVSETFRKSLPNTIGKRSFLFEDDDSLSLNKLNLSSDKIYGRDSEIALLRTALERIQNQQQGDENNNNECIATTTTPPKKLVLISGRSGTGKSVVAQQLCAPVRHGGGFFVTGKFDLQQGVEPYTAFGTALNELCDAILSKPASLREELIHRIREAAGSESKVLTDMIPKLQNLIGTPTTATAESGNMEARNRLHFLLRKFARAVGSPSHPLVMVLDDLQWADTASLELLESLVTDTSNTSLLILGTLRDNEIDSEHALSKHLKAIQASPVKVIQMQCQNLDSQAVNCLVSEALNSSLEATKVLADIVHHKTQGNAFFVVQFLQSLVDDELLKFSFGLMKWSWDNDAIQSLDVTDNIVELMMDKIQKIPADRQFALQVAACLGQSFRVETLTLVMEKLEEENFSLETNEKTNTRRSITEILQNSFSDVEQTNNETTENERKRPSMSRVVSGALQALLSDGLLEKVEQRRSVDDGAVYSFVHDQIQDAALSLIPEARRPQLQLWIGRTLLGDDSPEQRLSLAVDLYNRGSSSIPSGDEEWIKLADHNLMAGMKAMENAAFVPAAMYFNAGLNCLGSAAKDAELDTLHMKLLYAVSEAEFCNGNFEAMQTHVDQAIARARTFDDKIRPYLTLILSCGVREDCREQGIDTAFYVLEKMGMVKFPKTVSTFTVLAEIIKTKNLLKKHTQISLSHLPILLDERRESAMRILDLLVTMTYYSRPAHLPLVILRMIRWSVKYGVCKHSPTAFATYGMVLCGKLGDLKGGFMCGEVALTLLDRLKSKESMSRTLFLVYGMVHHWTKDEHLSIKPFLYGHQVGMETGDIEQAMYNLDIYGITAYYTSMKLDALEEEMESHCRLMSDYKHDSIHSLSLCRWQCILNLLGRSDDPLVLTGKAMDQEQMTKLAVESNNRLLQVVVDAYRLPLAYIFQDYALADELAERTRGIGTEILVAHIFVPRHLFYSGLTALAFARLNSKKKRKHLRCARKILQTMKTWVKAGNTSCLHMIKLMEAELASVNGRTGSLMDRATELYNDAISLAARSGYLQDRALAHERAGLLFLDRQDYYWAAYHLDRSIHCYRDWGALAKVHVMVEKHAALLSQHSTTSDGQQIAFGSFSDHGGSH